MADVGDELRWENDLCSGDEGAKDPDRRGKVIEFNAHGAPFDKMGNICTITVVIESLPPSRTDL